jgi:ubiquinone/menaquinone biosynthesis C-methylase UbiE
MAELTSSSTTASACCSAGQQGALSPGGDVREQVRQRYAAAAREVDDASQAGCCGVGASDKQGRQVFGAALYSQEDSEQAGGRLDASLGCGVPTAVAALSEGETVLDLGSGAGADVLISARRVGPSGRAIGLDMTDEMLDLARRIAEQAAVQNVEFLKGYIEQIPLEDASVDVVISNCVLNLSANKPKVIAEAARVLRPGGRFAISDVLADPDMDQATRADMQQWTGCIAGALTRQEFEQALSDAGLVEIEISETHRVHEHAGAAVIRAVKPTNRR